jgi:CubicO group peptidase (beta-lactamase class C family)
MLLCARFAICLLLASVSVSPAWATEARPDAQASAFPPPGQYRGQLALPAGQLSLVLHLSIDEGGTWTALLDVPVQKASGVPLRDVAVTAETVRFTLDSPAGTGTFEGRYEVATKQIAGRFKQGALDVQLVFHADNPELRLADAQAKLSDYDAKMEQWLKDWSVPGCAVGVILNGEVVLAKGYGVKNLDSKQPVTADTLFPIGSATKAFTVALLAQLVDEGKLDWDKPVHEYLPGFRLYNDDLSDQLTVRDMVTHRSGLPRHDALWYGSSFTREEIVHRLRYLEPNEPIRAQFQYNNLMFLTAGYLDGVLRGSTWEEEVQQRLLTPLGMDSSVITTAQCTAAPDHAEGYWQIPDEKGMPKPPSFIPLSDFPACAPAGSISSSINDMLKWAAFQLGDGTVSGAQIVSLTQLKQMHTMQMAISSPPDNPRSPIQGYGMGWFISDYRGHYCVDHGGNIDGFSAMVRLFPFDNLAIVVLTNLAATPLTNIAAYGAADRLLGLDENDISGRLLAQRQQAQASQAAGQGAAPQRPTGKQPGAAPAHPLADYAGEYVHPGYGMVQVTLGSDGKLHGSFNTFAMTLGHVWFETFEVTDENPILHGTQIMFVTDATGHVTGLSIQLEPAVDPIVFTHQPASPVTDPTFAAAVVGTYAVAGAKAAVSIRNGVLYMHVPGQPEYELVPLGGYAFSLRGLTGYSVKFKFDTKTATIAKAYLSQPDGTYEAVKQ